jgi:hypothetical protein
MNTSRIGKNGSSYFECSLDFSLISQCLIFIFIPSMVIFRMTIPQLKHICEVLDIERGGTKSAIVDRIMDFLMKPQSSGLKVSEKKKSKYCIQPFFSFIVDTAF